MPYGCSGYEYIVKGGYKIDVKSPIWDFTINYNRYVKLLEEKNSIKEEVSRLLIFTNQITDIHKSLIPFKRYEWIDKLKCIKEIEELCRKLKTNQNFDEC